MLTDESIKSNSENTRNTLIFDSSGNEENYSNLSTDELQLQYQISEEVNSKIVIRYENK